MVNLVKEPVFRRAFLAGSLSAFVSGCAKGVNDGWVKVDEFLPMAKENFLADILPDGYVFSCYMVATTLIASFRTSFALSRFANCAGNLHEMGSKFFQAASSLFAFCRNSAADDEEVEKFQETLIRMLSLLNALCLESLEEAAIEDEERVASGRKAVDGHEYELIDQESLDLWFQEYVHEMPNTKPETVFESIEFLIMANMKNNVLAVPPPLMGLPLGQLSSGLLDYHDGMKMIYEKTPLAYSIMTVCVLAATTTFVPLMMAVAARGPAGSMSITFGFVFAVWFMYGAADTLDNPYKKSANVIDAEIAQKEMNSNLLKLMSMRKHAVPSVDMEIIERKRGSPKICSGLQETTAAFRKGKGRKPAGKAAGGGGGSWSLPEFSFGGGSAQAAPPAKKAAPKRAGRPEPPQEDAPPPRPRTEPKRLSPTARLQEISKMQQVANRGAEGLLQRHGSSPLSTPSHSPVQSPSRRSTQSTQSGQGFGMLALPGSTVDVPLQLLDGAGSAPSSPTGARAQ